MTNSLKTGQIIAIAALLAFGGHIATAAWVSAPANPPSANVEAPLNGTTSYQGVDGPLWVNTGGNGGGVGLTVGQGVRITSAYANLPRLIIDGTADSAGHWAGLELRKDGQFQGGIFRLGGADAANNISIWNKTKAVVAVNQDDVVDFTGPIKISGGTPAAGEVLTSSDSFGTASWEPAASSGGTATPGTYTLGPVTHHPNKTMVDGNKYALRTDVALCPSGKGPTYWDSRGFYYKDGYGWPQYEVTCNWTYASNRFDYSQETLQQYFTCPPGSVLAGFNYYNAGDNFGRTGSLYCREFIGVAGS